MSSHVTENNVGTRVHIPDSESQDGTWRRRTFVGSLRIQRDLDPPSHTQTALLGVEARYEEGSRIRGNASNDTLRTVIEAGRSTA